MVGFDFIDPPKELHHARADRVMHRGALSIRSDPVLVPALELGDVSVLHRSTLRTRHRRKGSRSASRTRRREGAPLGMGPRGTAAGLVPCAVPCGKAPGGGTVFRRSEALRLGEITGLASVQGVSRWVRGCGIGVGVRAVAWDRDSAWLRRWRRSIGDTGCARCDVTL